MSTDVEYYDQLMTALLNDTLKYGWAKAEPIVTKKKIYGSRRAIRRVLKARKERESSNDKA